VYRRSGRPFVRSQNVDWGALRLRDLAFLDEQTHALFRASEIRGGDVLLNITGASIGRSAVAAEALDGGNVNQHVCEIRLDKRRMDPAFVCSVLLSQLGQDQIASFQAGGNRQGLNFQQVGSITIPTPPIDEQRAIARVLGDVTRLIATLERMIAKKEAVKRGMIQHLLSGKSRLPGFKAKRQPIRLETSGSTYGGLAGKSKSDFDSGSARFVTFLEVINNVRLRGDSLAPVRVAAGEHQNQVARGDVLFNGSSETPEEVALAAVVDFDPQPGTYLNSFCFGYRLARQDLIDPTYLAYLFRASIGRRLVSALAQGATRYNISKRKVLGLAPEFPPIEEQRAIAAAVTDADWEIDSLRRRLSKAKAIKQGMMQELLTGRTRLPVMHSAAA
jgi:type I restriction enzyme, S subunit